MTVANVRSTWVKWNTPFEARAPYMYLDIFGYVTGAVGLLLENRSTKKPTAEVYTFPWRRNRDGSLATHAEIDDEWNRVKDRQDLKDASLERRRAITTLYLAEPDVERLTLNKFDEFVGILRIEFPTFDSLPEAAIRGIASMAWARGPYNFRHDYPRFYERIMHRDWIGAAAECKVADTNNPGLVPRNAANKALFMSLAASPSAPAITPTPVTTSTAPSLWQRFLNYWSN